MRNKLTKGRGQRARRKGAITTKGETKANNQQNVPNQTIERRFRALLVELSWSGRWPLLSTCMRHNLTVHVLTHRTSAIANAITAIWWAFTAALLLTTLVYALVCVCACAGSKGQYCWLAGLLPDCLWPTASKLHLWCICKELWWPAVSLPSILQPKMQKLPNSTNLWHVACGMWHTHMVDKCWPPLSALNWYHRRLLFVACDWQADTAVWYFRWFSCKLKCVTNKIATNANYLYAPPYMLHATCVHSCVGKIHSTSMHVYSWVLLLHFCLPQIDVRVCVCACRWGFVLLKIYDACSCIEHIVVAWKVLYVCRALLLN